MKTLDAKLQARIKHLGYRVSVGSGNIVTLRPESGPNFIHNKFRSVFSAADYLVSLTRDDVLREMVSGL